MYGGYIIFSYYSWSFEVKLASMIIFLNYEGLLAYKKASSLNS